jgi:predicted ATP-grasp superfamily ATP-dependent carboligase
VLAVGLNGLGAIRSLRKDGITPIPIFTSGQDVGSKSNGFEESYFVADDEDWEEKVYQLLLSIAPARPIPIIACSDRAAQFLQQYGDKLLKHYSLLIPPADIISTLNDKRLEITRMLEHGIPLPPSEANLDSRENIAEQPPLNLPVIIKPRTFADFSALDNAKNITVYTRQEWLDFYHKFGSQLHRLVAQEIIPGGDSNLWVCNATFDTESNMICGFSFRRLGTAPPHYGVTSLARSETNPRILELVQDIGRALGFVGPGMFEFKYDDRSNDYLYIETNPRIGLCNWFDTSCGINNVATTCRLAVGETLMTRQQQIDNRVFLNLAADFISRLEDGKSVLSILSVYRKLIGHRFIFAFFTIRDMRPFFFKTRVIIKRYTKPVLRFFLGRLRFSGK